MVVDLDEGLVGDAVFGEVEGLLEAELVVEGAGGGEVVDADGDVGDAVEGRRRAAVGLGVSEAGEESEDESACEGLADAEGRLQVHSLSFWSGWSGEAVPTRIVSDEIARQTNRFYATPLNLAKVLIRWVIAGYFQGKVLDRNGLAIKYFVIARYGRPFVAVFGFFSIYFYSTGLTKPKMPGFRRIFFGE